MPNIGMSNIKTIKSEINNVSIFDYAIFSLKRYI